MNEQKPAIRPPEILAPAGNKASFLAAVAARADAIYCGLKLFSARMEAKNFTLEEFVALVRLAHKQGVKVFVALNSLLKPGDLAQAGQMLDQLQHRVKPDAIIIQDLALVPLVKQTGFAGEIHLSTLANVSFPKALQIIRQKLRQLFKHQGNPAGHRLHTGLQDFKRCGRLGYAMNGGPGMSLPAGAAFAC